MVINPPYSPNKRLNMKHSFYLLWLVISAALTVAGCDHAGHKGHDKPDEEKKEHAHGEDEILFSEEKAKAAGIKPCYIVCEGVMIRF